MAANKCIKISNKLVRYATFLSVASPRLRYIWQDNNYNEQTQNLLTQWNSNSSQSSSAYKYFDKALVYNKNGVTYNCNCYYTKTSYSYSNNLIVTNNKVYHVQTSTYSTGCSFLDFSNLNIGGIVIDEFRLLYYGTSNYNYYNFNYNDFLYTINNYYEDSINSFRIYGNLGLGGSTLGDITFLMDSSTTEDDWIDIIKPQIDDAISYEIEINTVGNNSFMEQYSYYTDNNPNYKVYPRLKLDFINGDNSMSIMELLIFAPKYVTEMSTYAIYGGDGREYNISPTVSTSWANVFYISQDYMKYTTYNCPIDYSLYYKVDIAMRSATYPNRQLSITAITFNI